MAEFEFQFLAECGTPLQIGIVEAESLSDAAKEIGLQAEFLHPDADAVRLTIEEVAR